MVTGNETTRLRVVLHHFNRFILDGIPRLRKLGYNPFQFLEMVHRHGDVVGATKQLLADPRHTSYGFQRLYELGRLGDSVEFASCLPWFADLFEPHEIDEARTRLVAHDFQLDSRLATVALDPPDWYSQL